MRTGLKAGGVLRVGVWWKVTFDAWVLMVGMLMGGVGMLRGRSIFLYECDGVDSLFGVGKNVNP